MDVKSFYGTNTERLREHRNPSDPENPNLQPDAKLGEFSVYKDLDKDGKVVRVGLKIGSDIVYFKQSELEELLKLF